MKMLGVQSGIATGAPPVMPPMSKAQTANSLMKIDVAKTAAF